MRRSILSVALAAVLVAAAASPAAAASANITPYTQSHGYGVASHWTLTWGTYSPYTVFFDYGDGNEHDWSSTTLSGYYQSYTFWPCHTTRFQQELGVRDSHNGIANDYSYATETGGVQC